MHRHTAHSGVGAESTLETAIVTAASLTAALLEGGEQRAVGLLAVSGRTDDRAGNGSNRSGQTNVQRTIPGALNQNSLGEDALLVPPLPGRAQLWRVLSALAPVEPSDVSLAQVLHQSGPALGRRRSLVVITSIVFEALVSKHFEKLVPLKVGYSLNKLGLLSPVQGQKRQVHGPLEQGDVHQAAHGPYFLLICQRHFN